MRTRTLDEAAVAAGTVMLTSHELAPRIGFGSGQRGAQKVRNRAKLGLIPCYQPNSRTFLFHWPTVAAALANGKGRRLKT